MRGLLLIPLVLTVACTPVRGTLPVDPGVTFAAHRAGSTLVLDRLPGGGSGTLVPPGRLTIPNAPDLVLRVGDETRAALWIIGRSRVLVRAEASTIAPRIAEVLSTWDGPAIRLTLYGRDGAALRTDVFARSDEAPGRPTLARDAGTLDSSPRQLLGAYRTVVRDERGAAVGWLRIEVRPSDGVSRLFDGVFPGMVDPGLAAATAVALDAEIAWIEQHGVEPRD